MEFLLFHGQRGLRNDGRLVITRRIIKLLLKHLLGHLLLWGLLLGLLLLLLFANLVAQTLFNKFLLFLLAFELLLHTHPLFLLCGS